MDAHLPAGRRGRIVMVARTLIRGKKYPQLLIASSLRKKNVLSGRRILGKSGKRQKTMDKKSRERINPHWWRKTAHAGRR